MPNAAERTWERRSHEHAILQHFLRTGDGRAVRFTDFVTQRQFQRTGLYNEFFRPLGLCHQLAFMLRDRGRLRLAVALNRQVRDFSERERLILNLLRPHLSQAYRNAAAVTKLREELARLRGALEKLDRGVIFLFRGGTIRSMTETAQRWLEEHFRARPGRAGHLPEELERWVKQQRALLGANGTMPPPRQPFVVEGEGKRLVVRMISETEQSLLILEQRRTAFDASVFEPLGLSGREAEVLFWLGRGKTNGESALILGSKSRTVEKHVERILQKLSVENRTAAAAMALRAI